MFHRAEKRPRHTLTGIRELTPRLRAVADCAICGPDIEAHFRKLPKEHWLCAQRVRASNREVNARRGSSANFRNNLRKYKLTQEQYEALLLKQGGVCAVCKRPPTKRRLSVDHDHLCCDTKASSCGACVRGLLCTNCNSLLAMCNDREALLQNALDYLRGK